MDDGTKQVILAARFPGVTNSTVWSDPATGSQIDFSSFAHLARTAEAGKFDFFFLTESLRLREHRGKIHDLDVAGRPNTFTVLAALAAVTTHLGLGGTIAATCNEPYEVARQFATLDHLSAGRAAWNVVTSPDAFSSENFRRGGVPDREDRYGRTAEFVATCRELWNSWPGDAVAADTAAGTFMRNIAAGTFAHRGEHFDISGHFNAPASPQGHPVIIQAGDSGGGKEFAAASADAVCTRHSALRAGQAFYADVKSRLGRYGRRPSDLKVLPRATFVLGDSAADARDRARHIRRQQVSPQTAILLLEQVWNRDLSGYDPDGPLPSADPDTSSASIQGRTRQHASPLVTARRWRALAEEKQLSIRELIIEVTGRQSFIGTPAQVAEEISSFVQSDAADGFVLVPHLVPAGLDEFVATVVPRLQERGVFRAEYETDTLRGHLGLVPARCAHSGTGMAADTGHQPERIAAG
jgi:FMN-dependent oxidoreductase (nitrilotriacetate monooxygenase family)